jgi:hypothetical protein
MLHIVVSIIILLLSMSNISFAEGVPSCLSPNAETNTESLIASHSISDQELLTRLVYAEGMSTGFGDDHLVYDAIAWGVMNRVRLGERSRSMQRAYGLGIRRVIFKKGQFNPAISKTSQFSKEFLCPEHAARWNMARNASETAIKGNCNPFIQTPWEKRNNLALVVNFYYPQSSQAKGRFAPWEGNKSLTFIGDLMLGTKTLPAVRIRFYRLKYPPTDMKTHKKTSKGRSEKRRFI